MRTLLIVRGLAIIAVVLGHAIGWVYLGQSWWLDSHGATAAAPVADQVGSLSHHVLYAVAQLSLFDVPAFLFASGFFISYAARGGKGVSWKMTRRWIEVLIWPFVIWVVVLVGASWLPLALFSRKELPSLADELKSAIQIAYFVPLVCQFYLFGPLIARLAKSGGRWLLLGAGLLQLGAMSLWYLPRLGVNVGANVRRFLQVNEFFFWKWAIYFPLGAVCGFNFKPVKAWLVKYRMALLAAVIVLGSLAIVEMEILCRSGRRVQPTHYTFSVAGYSVATILLLLAVGERWIPMRSQVSDMGTKSLGIYLSHTSVLVIVARAVYHTVPSMMFQPVVFLSVLFASALGLPLLLGNVLTKYARRTLYPYLFG
jgi:membrane-bound acyltransferase YfiQ involved in biofilm formation